MDAFVAELEPGFVANALNQSLLKLVCPGVPDIYQGTELWDFSLVDPDNRRPVDYALRQRHLASLEENDVHELWEARADGRIKLHLLQCGLRLRSEKPLCFGPQGGYRPLRAAGAHADRVLAFRRGEDVLAVVCRFWCKHGKQLDDTNITLPEGHWRNVLTRADGLQGTVAVHELIHPLPCAILVRTAA